MTGNNNTPDLVALWDDSMDDNFNKAEAKLRLSLKNQIDKVTPRVKETITKYEKTSLQLGIKEKSKRKQYLAEQKSKQKQLATSLAREKRNTQREAADVEVLRKRRTTGMTDAQKDALKQDVTDTKKRLFAAEMTESLTQRAIHELYSPSCKKIAKNLKKDLMRLKNYEKMIDGISLRRL